MKSLFLSIMLTTFGVGLNANVKTISNDDSNSEEDTVFNNCTVRYDCDGDGEADYEQDVDCDYAEELEQQYIDSCG